MPIDADTPGPVRWPCSETRGRRMNFAHDDDALTLGRKCIAWDAPDVFEKLVDDNPGLARQADALGMTLLMDACKSADPSFARLLVARGADVAATDGKGETALIHALRHHAGPAARILLEQGADARVRSQAGATTLQLAAAMRDTPLARTLVEAGVTLDSWSAAALGWTEELARLLPTDRSALESNVPEVALTASALAIRHGDVKTLETLLEAGAKVDADMLAAAIDRGDLRLVEALLHHGGNASASDTTGWTLLHRASAAGRAMIVDLLLEHGADPSASTERGITPMSVAKSRKVVELLQRPRRALPPTMDPP